MGYRKHSAWLDEDGKHIWFMHRCVKGGESSMLPYPKWKADEQGIYVTPSIVCNECGFHEIVKLIKRDS